MLSRVQQALRISPSPWERDERATALPIEPNGTAERVSRRSLGPAARGKARRHSIEPASRAGRHSALPVRSRMLLVFLLDTPCTGRVRKAT